MQKQNEIDAIQQKEFDKEEAFNQGKWKGEVKGEIKQIKFGLKYKMDEEKIVEETEEEPAIEEEFEEYEDSELEDGPSVEKVKNKTFRQYKTQNLIVLGFLV